MNIWNFPLFCTQINKKKRPSLNGFRMERGQGEQEIKSKILVNKHTVTG